MAPLGSASTEAAELVGGVTETAHRRLHLQRSSRGVQMSNKLVSDLQVSFGLTRQMENAELLAKTDDIIRNVTYSWFVDCDFLPSMQLIKCSWTEVDLRGTLESGRGQRHVYSAALR
jgi:hypothetical protein